MLAETLALAAPECSADRSLLQLRQLRQRDPKLRDVILLVQPRPSPLARPVTVRFGSLQLTVKAATPEELEVETAKAVAELTKGQVPS
jgi:hypothetical protein